MTTTRVPDFTETKKLLRTGIEFATTELDAIVALRQQQDTGVFILASWDGMYSLAVSPEGIPSVKIEQVLAQEFSSILADKYMKIHKFSNGNDPINFLKMTRYDYCTIIEERLSSRIQTGKRY